MQPADQVGALHSCVRDQCAAVRAAALEDVHVIATKDDDPVDPVSLGVRRCLYGQLVESGDAQVGGG